MDAEVGEAAEQAAAPLRVLVVEDNEDGREMLGALLDLLGYRWHACADAEAALAALAPTDLLLTDLSLPGMSGTALADLARARHPGLPAIFCSGRDVDAAALAGARLLPKPFTLDQLQQELAGAGMPAPA